MNINQLYQPIETWRDVPMSTYRRTGKNAMYIPITGGTPPSSAYAIPRKKKNMYTPTPIPKSLIINDKNIDLNCSEKPNNSPVTKSKYLL